MLTKRQKSEQQFYDEWVKKKTDHKVLFDLFYERPHVGNPYWYLYEQLMSQDLKNKRVLDFGCGSGSNSIILANLGAIVYGFDISYESLKIAKEKARKYGVAKRVYFSQSVGEKLCFKDQSFDLIFGSDILHHLDIGPSISEMRRVLRKGGWGYFKEWHTNTFLTLISYVFKKFSRRGEYTPHEKPLSKDDLDKLRKQFKTVTFSYFDLAARRISLGRMVLVKAQRIDYFLLRWFPFLKPWSGSVVIAYQK